MTNLEMMNRRLKWQGGNQEQRMIKDKYKSMRQALVFSYQGADVRLAQAADECLDLHAESAPHTFRALINPNRLVEDYDNKILSIDYAAGYQVGDIIEWVGTQTHWLVYLQQLTEDAYFRSEIRRCRYEIKFKDESGIVRKTWAAIIGPTSASIDQIAKGNVIIDKPNYSLNILLPNNEYTRAAFDRYKEFILKGKAWQIQSVDSISTEGILGIYAEEHYIDKEDDDVENEISDGLIVEPVDPTPESGIEGETFIKPMIAEIFVAPEEGGSWCTTEKMPVSISAIDNKSIELTWKKSTSGQFILQWSKDDITLQKVIVVESLF